MRAEGEGIGADKIHRWGVDHRIGRQPAIATGLGLVHQRIDQLIAVGIITSDRECDRRIFSDGDSAVECHRRAVRPHIADGDGDNRQVGFMFAVRPFPDPEIGALEARIRRVEFISASCAMLKRLHHDHVAAVGHIIIEVGDQHLKGHRRVFGGADLKRVGDGDKVQRVPCTTAITRLSHDNGIFATGRAIIPIPSRTALKTDRPVAHKASGAAGITEGTVAFQPRRTDSNRTTGPAAIGVLAKEVKDMPKAGRAMIGIAGGAALPADRSYPVVSRNTFGITQATLRLLVGGADQPSAPAAAVTRLGEDMGIQAAERAIIGVAGRTISVTDRAVTGEASFAKGIAELPVLFCASRTSQVLRFGMSDAGIHPST